MKKEIYFLIVLVIFILLYLCYYLYAQNNIRILKETEFYVEIDDETDLSAISKKWIEGYLGQYSQNFVNSQMQLKNIYVYNVYVEDNDDLAVQIDFSATKVKNKSTYFTDWIGIDDPKDNSTKFNWVILLDIREDEYGNRLCYVKERLMPSQYQLRYYQSSGQGDKEKDYIENIQENDYQKKEFIYKIYSNKLYVSHESGNNWKEVPVLIDNLLLGSDENGKLQEGSYQILPTKTAFLYGDANKIPLSIVYSDNMDLGWENIAINNEKIIKSEGIKYKYINFISKNEGKLVVVYYDKTLNQYVSLTLNTTDGGITWNEIGEFKIGNHESKISVKFFNQSVGFILITEQDEKKSGLYRTVDGGNTFKKVEIPTIELEKQNGIIPDFYDVYDTPQLPYQENQYIVLKVNQGTDGTYKGGKTIIKYKSKNLGETWE